MSSVNRQMSFSILLCAGLLSFAAGCQQTAGWACNTSGKMYYQRGQYAMARYKFQEAAMYDPNNPDYRHNLAMSLNKTGDPLGAERVLRENLTQVSAMHQPSYHSLAQMLVEQQRGAEAEQLLAGWSQTQPYVPESNVELAWIQRQNGNPAAAEQSLRNALRADPRHPTALAHLGQLYEDSGQPDRAAAMYQRSLATKWQQPQVQSRLQMVSSGTSPRVPTRSAMMMNPSMAPTMSAYGPAPMMSAAPSAWTVSSQPTPIGSSPIMAAAPSLGPTPDPTASALTAPVMAAPSPTIDPNSGIAFEAPLLAGPTIMPNADPAHAQPEMTAELPLVDPR